MTKEELDRIKEAYYSGLKVQVWFDGHWENFDIRDYPINQDPFSEHRVYRIVGSAYVDIAEKQIADLKAQLEAEKKLNEEIKVRFVKCNTCTDEMKNKCLMFSENLCEGDRCEELVDLLELINKSDLQKENARLKLELEALDGQVPWKDIKDKSEVLGKLAEAKEILQIVLNKWKEERRILQSEEEVKQIENLMKQAKQFLKVCK